MKTTKKPVDLSLLKRLVAELETTIQGAETFVGKDSDSFLVEMNKAAGVAAGIMKESVLLINDIDHAMYPSAPKGGDALSQLLGNLKGQGGAN